MSGNHKLTAAAEVRHQTNQLSYHCLFGYSLTIINRSQFGRILWYSYVCSILCAKLTDVFFIPICYPLPPESVNEHLSIFGH